MFFSLTTKHSPFLRLSIKEAYNFVVQETSTEVNPQFLVQSYTHTQEKTRPADDDNDDDGKSMKGIAVVVIVASSTIGEDEAEKKPVL